MNYCDTCGQPATNYARDHYEIESTSGVESFKPKEKLKSGCDLHPVFPEITDLDGSVREVGK